MKTIYTLKIKPFDDSTKDSVCELYKDHSVQHLGDCGVDLYCLQDYAVPSGARSFPLKFGIACEMEYFTSGVGCVGNPIIQSSGYWLAPRSSISKTPLRMSNSMGVIDGSYRGEIMAKVDNLSDKEYFISKGDRLFQLVTPMMIPMNVQLVDSLSKTSRGTGGFGSTGK